MLLGQPELIARGPGLCRYSAHTIAPWKALPRRGRCLLRLHFVNRSRTATAKLLPSSRVGIAWRTSLTGISGPSSRWLGMMCLHASSCSVLMEGGCRLVPLRPFQRPIAVPVTALRLAYPHGSCAAAAYLGRPVYSVDIETDPIWADFRDVALQHGYRSCWSTPIRNSNGAIIGTFAILHRTVGMPTHEEIEAIELITEHVADAIMWSCGPQSLARPDRRSVGGHC